jgi:hypothetical protein
MLRVFTVAVTTLVCLLAVARAEGTVAPYAGAAFGRYTEKATGLKFASDLQPFLFAGIEGGIPVSTGALVLGAQAGFGTDVHMDAVQFGEVLQNNRFKQEIYEGTVRYRWSVRGNLFAEAGYRFTMQRLHFSDIEDAQGNSGIIDGANEDVMAHAIEGGIGWHVRRPDASRRTLLFNIGITRGSAENDQITGATFHASGMVFRTVASHRWRSGLQATGILAWRQQNGSGQKVVMVQGMETTAFWPKNITWMLGVALGYAF